MALWPSLLPETFSVLVFGFVVLNCFGVDKFGSHPLLPLDEVQILQTISNKLNIRNWTTINQTSCGSPQWNQASSDDKTQSIVTCNCTFEKGSVCHVTNIRVKRYNLNGVLPEELGDLPHLLEIDLTRNYINGTIPPRLAQLPNLKILSLIVNRLTGPIPPEIGNITTLEELLLSANNFSGTIPDTFGNLKNLNDLFLNNNLLTGEVPAWILESKEALDLSYNNFTGSVQSTQSNCRQLPVNLVASHVSTGINNISWCLNKDLVCPIKPPQYHSLFINCGGRRETVGDNEYEDDATSGGAAKFESSSERWGYSSTGTHIGTENGAYIATNSYGLNVTGEGFYQTARLAPQSLKYYGLCMLAGSYKVQLHFAEIMYSNSQTFSSLGRRIFDISIQGKVVETNFNIMEEAGGVGIGITKVYDGIIVNGSTLEIHLYWSGKGTTAVPDRGVYGPLISAITVTPNFKVDNGGGLSVGAIIGIVAASCVLAALILLVLRKKGYLGGKDLEDKVKMHEGQIPVQAPIVKRSTMNQDARFKAFELLSHDSQTHVSNGSQSSRIQKSISMDGPWMDSEFSIESKDEIIEYSSSTKLLKDLYDVNLD
ncbi:hypothetical protein D5086_003359 [Populus alba]|uniref:Uncharacterized protein n=1 Tax=Populus alba TaxID=43335 RepID=A0ACC4D5N0_POPAL